MFVFIFKDKNKNKNKKMEQNCCEYSSILKDYLREVKYVENINKHFEFIVCDIWDRKSLLIECRNAVDKDDYVKKI